MEPPLPKKIPINQENPQLARIEYLFNKLDFQLDILRDGMYRNEAATLDAIIRDYKSIWSALTNCDYKEYISLSKLLSFADIEATKFFTNPNFSPYTSPLSHFTSNGICLAAITYISNLLWYNLEEDAYDKVGLEYLDSLWKLITAYEYSWMRMPRVDD